MKTHRTSAVPTDIVASARRVEERSALQLPCWVHAEAGRRWEATITDITTAGCRLTSSAELSSGSYVTIIIRSTLIGGRIAWQDDGAVGIEFGARLLPKTLRIVLSVAEGVCQPVSA